MKKITLLVSLIAIAVAMVAGQSVYADTATISVSPAVINSVSGTPFNVSIQLDPAGNKVCVVKGILSLDNLDCQSITLANGITAQVAPTCSSPSFVLGIPKCTTVAQNIFSVSVKGIKAGQGNLSLVGMKVIGVGVDVASSIQGGAYNITAVQTVAPKTVTPETTAPKTTQQVGETTQEKTGEVVSPTNQEPTQTNAEQPLVAGQQASLATAYSSKTIIIIVIILLVIVIIWGLWYMFGKKKKNK